MLVLTRKPGEGIVIADTIQLTVVAIRGNHVQLGFTAPSETPIRRAERWHPPNGDGRPPANGVAEGPDPGGITRT
jgi:carbon storage regulator